MGKTKTKIMDDSVQEEALAKGQSSSGRKKLGRQDELVERLKAELATEEPTQSSAVKKDKEVARGDAEEGSRRVAAKSEASEDAGPLLLEGRDTEAAGPRAKGKLQKPGKSKPRSKKYQEAIKLRDQNLPAGRQAYPLNEAVELTKKLSYTKQVGTLEAHINTVQTGIRGLVSLPFSSGKKLTILAFGKGAESSGADVVGSDETIKQINNGKVDFDLLITTPEWMPKLAKVARILGPRGLMPNPKNGTITTDLKKTIEGFQAGKTEYERSSKMIYKTEAKTPVIHLGLGKLDQPTEELSANIKTLLQTLGKTRVKKVTLSPTMGPSVKLDINSI